jgi:uncharacterized membrane protein YoaK (UPF0700 family)
MQAFIESGDAIMVVIGFVVVEIIAVIMLRRSRAVSIIISIIPGLCLMLALLAALQKIGWQVIAFWITLSLPFHLIDLRSRLRS